MLSYGKSPNCILRARCDDNGASGDETVTYGGRALFSTIGPEHWRRVFADQPVNTVSEQIRALCQKLRSNSSTPSMTPFASLKLTGPAASRRLPATAMGANIALRIG